MNNITFRKLLVCVACLSCLSYLVSFWMHGEAYLSNHSINYVTKQDGNDAEILVVGGGLSGAIIAHLHATLLRKKVLLVEKENHVGGSCYDYVDKHGIRVSKYGLHVLHTNNELVLRYLSQFSKWIPYEHRVVAKIKDHYVPIPLNIDSINTIFNLSIMSSENMIKWLKHHPYADSNQVLGVTREEEKYRLAKQLADHTNRWFEVSQDLRIGSQQIRRNFDDRYFPKAIYTALPTDGYTSVITQMLNHRLITVLLNFDFKSLENNEQYFPNVNKTFFTGRIDKYFENSGLQELKYRRVVFETIHLNKTLFQPNLIVEHPLSSERSARITEYRHPTNPKRAGTTIVREYHGNRGHPYYPISDKQNTKLYSKYEVLAKEEMKKNVFFVGGPGHYKYYTIGETVMNAVADFKKAYPHISFSDSDIFSKHLIKTKKSKTRKCSVAFITSHCKEYLSWISKYLVPLCTRYTMDIFIYEKCDKTNMGSELIKKYPQCSIHQIVLPNVGREGHSWLHHMMTQQSSFADVNVFVQGGKEVSKGVLFRTIDRMKKVVNLNPSYYEIKTKDFRNHYKPFSYNSCFNITKGALNWTIEAILERTCDYFYSITKTKEHCTEYGVNYRGEFAVTAALLHRMLARHRDVISVWYEDLSTRSDPLQGHLVERSWTLLFSHPFIPRC